MENQQQAIDALVVSMYSVITNCRIIQCLFVLDICCNATNIH